MGLRNVILSALIALIAANLILAEEPSVVQPQPQPQSSENSRLNNPWAPSGPFSPNPPGFNSFGSNPPGFNSFGSNPPGFNSFGSNPAPRPPGFNSPGFPFGFDYSQFVPFGFRSTRDVNSLNNNNLEEPSEANPSESSPPDTNPRISPFSFISQFFPSTFGNSRQTRDVSFPENNNKQDDPHQRLSPFGSNPLGSIPFGSNIFGSLPFGSNPFGSLPFGFNISQFLPFGFGNSRQTRDVSSQESNTEDDPRQRLFFSLGSRLTTCNYTETPGISCANCFQALTCLPSNVGYIRRCTFYCNTGRCSFVAGSQCTNSTG